MMSNPIDAATKSKPEFFQNKLASANIILHKLQISVADIPRSPSSSIGSAERLGSADVAVHAWTRRWR
jgi:hypothetical protein